MQSQSRKARYIGYAIFGLCLFVLLFSAQVKLSQYRASAPAPNPVTASKLWLKNQKMESLTAGPLLLMVCLAFLFSATVPLVTRNFPPPQRLVPIVIRRERFERRRFLRPPPSF
jgi:hypothetical protein